MQAAAVVGIPHPKGGAIGVAYVVVRAGKAVEASALSSYLAQRLAKYKIPKEFRVVESLPRTPYGKVVKGEFRERYLLGIQQKKERS